MLISVKVGSKRLVISDANYQGSSKPELTWLKAEMF